MKLPILWILFLAAAAACQALPPGADSSPATRAPAEDASSKAAASLPALPDLGLAPEIVNETWLNVDGPLRLADLRGQVVALEMWTFGCINCKHVIPSLRDWHSRYAADGLVIIANHYPEFEYEKDLDNLRAAVSDQQIEYAVAQDNDGATWRAYKNRYWPTLYLIDKRGHLRYTHIGEGAYPETEAAIQALLAEPYP